MRLQSALFVAIILLGWTIVQATTITVTSLADTTAADGQCTLREAVAAAGSNAPMNECPAGEDSPIIDTIDLTGLSGTIALTGLPISIDSGLRINGPGANILSIDAKGLSRVIENYSSATIAGIKITGGVQNIGAGVANTGSLILSECVVSGNSYESPHAALGVGAGIATFDGVLILDRCTVSDNALTGDNSKGGGIYVDSGALIASNSTISGNSASGNLAKGGGIYNAGGMDLYNCTISNNHAGGFPGGGGIWDSRSIVPPPTVFVVNTIIAGNTIIGGLGTDGAADAAAFTSGGYNVIGVAFDGPFISQTGDQLGVDAQLGPLQDNGGTTFTMAPLPGSPAVDMGQPAYCSLDPVNSVDQRGDSRPQDGDNNGTATCDVGAVELPACLFCDDFNGGLTADWTILKLNWNVSNGSLNTIPSKKSEIVATGFAGCTTCSFQASVSVPAGKFTRLWMMVHYVDEKNNTQLLLKSGKKATLKEISNGKIVAKKSVNTTFTPDTLHSVKVDFNGTQYELFLDGTSLLTLIPTKPIAPGTIGFEAKKKTTASIDSVQIQ